MSRSDKLLFGIVGGIVILVIVAFGSALLRPAETYRDGDQPEDVVFNYLLALRNQDYARAYSYLSHRLPGYPPTLDDFTSSIYANNYVFTMDTGAALDIDQVSGTGTNRQVTVLQTQLSGGDLFSTASHSTIFTFSLRREVGGWKLYEGTRYFAWCWQKSSGCR